MPDPLNPLGRPATASAIRPRPRVGGGSGLAFDAAFTGMTEPPAVEATATGAIGREVLDVLAELQRGLLGPNVEAMPTDRLTRLLATMPEPADPGLAAVTRSILLRARIEIARRLPRSPPPD